MLTSFIKWLVMAAVITTVPYVVSGIEVTDFGAALAVAVVLSLLNLIVKPILILLTLPFTILSFGLFLMVINAFILQMAGFFVHGFRVESFGSAFLAALMISIVNAILGIRTWKLNRPEKKTTRQDGVIELHESRSGHWQ